MRQYVFQTLWALLILGGLALAACGGGDSDGTDDGEFLEPTSPENLMKMVFAEMATEEFSCASEHYFGENRIMEYFDSSTLGPAGTIGVCQKLREDARQEMYQRVIGATSAPMRTALESTGVMPRTLDGRSLPYAEGVLTLDDGHQIYFNRMVQHEGLWYVLVLRGYTRFY